MEKLNAEKYELTIEQLDAASGGALYQPLIVVAIVRAVAIKTAIQSLLHRITH